MNGEADRQVVMEALTASTDGSVPTFASADKNVIHSLAKHSGVVDPAKLGKYRTVAEYLKFKLGTNVFSVTIEAPNDKGDIKKYPLNVRPVQEIRSNVP